MDDVYRLRLYVANDTVSVASVVSDLRAALEARCPGRFSLEVTDILASPGVAVANEVFATPLLVREHPVPQARLLGPVRHAGSALDALSMP